MSIDENTSQEILDSIVDNPHVLENIDYCELVYGPGETEPQLINIWFIDDIENLSCSPDYEVRAEHNSFCALVKEWIDAGNEFSEKRYPDE